MTTHRRYFFTHQGPWDGGGHTKVAEILTQACSEHWWYRDPQVNGEPYNRMIIIFTVSGRDQWWCHRRALKLAEQCSRAIGMKVPEPTWWSLPPHTNRGYVTRGGVPVDSNNDHRTEP